MVMHCIIAIDHGMWYERDSGTWALAGRHPSLDPDAPSYRFRPDSRTALWGYWVLLCRRTGDGGNTERVVVSS